MDGLPGVKIMLAQYQQKKASQEAFWIFKKFKKFGKRAKERLLTEIRDSKPVYKSF